MKKLNLFLSLLLTIVLFSCNNDDDTPNDNENQNSELMAVWKITTKIENGVAITLIPGCEAESGYTFRPDNRYIENDFGTVNLGDSTRCDDDGIPGSWSVSENILTLNYDAFDGEPAFSLEYTFEISENTLILGYSEENYTETSTYTKI